MSGWVKLHRKLLDNPIVCKDSDHLSVWMYLLLNATHTEYPAMFGGKKIMLQPGQLITGRLTIAERLCVSESKVKRILLQFESDQQIERQRGNKNSVISVLNWEKYQVDDQQNDQQMTSKRPASDQQVTTNKNVKNNKNVKEHKKHYADNILLTEKEYTTLCEKYGKELTDRSIEYLSLYKVEKDYKTKSDNITIQRWVADAVKSKKTNVVHLNQNKPVQPNLFVPDEEDEVYKMIKALNSNV